MCKRNVIAVALTAVIAAVLLLPAALQHSPVPESSAAGNVLAVGGDIDTSDDVGSSSSLPESDEPATFYDLDEALEQPHEQGSVLVEISDEVSLEQFNSQLAELDYIAVDSVAAEEVALGYVELPLAEGVSVEDAVASLTNEPAINQAQPNYVYHLQDESSDDAAYSSSSLQAGSVELSAQATSINDPYASKQWGLEAVHAYEAWDYSRAQDASTAVTVAVLDTGMNVSHKDFESKRIVGAQTFLSGKSGSNVTDENGHGTHVAGIIAATVNNGVGVAGVSYNARIMPVQVLDAAGNTDTASLAKAIQYVIDNASKYNVRVVNISIGTDGNGADLMTDNALKTAIVSAHNKGLLVVYAAGNGGITGSYNSAPCDFDEAVGAIGVISVQKSGSTYTRTSSSNYNMAGQVTKDISAPGNSIYSTTRDGAYGYLSGTSMAAPYVSGIAALVFAAHPNATAESVRNTLVNTAQDIGSKGWDVQHGAGLVNAEAALKSVVPNASPTLSGSTRVAALGGTTMLSIVNGGVRTWTWSSSNKAVATVNANGLVTGKAAGSATITVSSSDGIVLTRGITVTSVSLASAKITLSKTSYYYDGTAKKPGVTVKLGTKTLVSGSDYTVSYSNNTKVGTATVTVTGKGNYTGTARATFRISYAVVAPACSGATKVPVGATATYVLTNGGSVRIKSGSAYATLSGATLTGKAAGTVVLSIRDKTGVERSTKTVQVYALSGSYTVRSAVNSSKVLDISGGSLRNGGNLQIWQSNNTVAQKFSFALQSDGSYRITCTHDGKALDVLGGSGANGANVQQYSWNGTNAQRWKISVDASNRLTFTNKGSGKVLDVAGGSSTNGANVHQYASNGTNAQKWTLSSTTCATGPVLDGVYRLTTKVNTGYALDVTGASQSNGANVQIYKSNGTAAQQWAFVYQGNGYYKVTCEASSKALDISGASKANGANAQQYSWNGTGAQLWKVMRNSDGSYTLTCKASGKVLDVAGGIAANGRNVWQYASNGTNAQKWVLYQY